MRFFPCSNPAYRPGWACFKTLLGANSRISFHAPLCILAFKSTLSKSPTSLSRLSNSPTSLTFFLISSQRKFPGAHFHRAWKPTVRSSSTCSRNTKRRAQDLQKGTHSACECVWRGAIISIRRASVTGSSLAHAFDYSDPFKCAIIQTWSSPVHDLWKSSPRVNPIELIYGTHLLRFYVDQPAWLSLISSADEIEFFAIFNQLLSSQYFV